MLIQEKVEKLNRDLHQPSRIRYESRSFSVICLVSLAYREGLISGVNLSVVVAWELTIERWRIEVVEAHVEDSVSPIRRRADRGCHYCNI